VGVPLPERYADLLAQDPRNPSDPHVRQVLELVRRFDRRREPIAVLVPGEERPIGHLHYGASSLGARVRWMPWLEAAAILVFMSVALLAFRNIKRSEQRSIWVGMAKETAHQLGTPLTSMNGWLALLSETGGAPGAVRPGAGGPQAAQATGAGAADSVLDREQVLGELARDLQRLTKVTERFSQIGRRPKLSLGRADQVAERVCAYFRRRLPHLGSHVRIESYLEEVPLAPLNEELLEWVLENLIKNALDAIDKAQGLVEVTCRYRPELQSVEILVSDNGKGMTPALQRRIFEPGFSTRKAGWGMGLVLVRRIVEEYHGGDVDVARSAPGVGTTMRVTLKAG
jgi:NtrC-family two-component system sensor histidine kinase KinB